MHVTSDVIIGVACGLLLMALCVLAIVFRTVHIARRKRLHDRLTQGIFIFIFIYLFANTMLCSIDKVTTEY